MVVGRLPEARLVTSVGDDVVNHTGCYRTSCTQAGAVLFGWPLQAVATQWVCT